MKVAIVTPYYRETDDVLRACLDSVRAQTHADCRHFLVADGFPNPLVDHYAATHIHLPAAHGDNGNLARCIGAFSAIAEGFDAIAFLDADNWYLPDHIERMVALQARTGAAVCTSGRSVHRLDGTLLYACDTESDGAAFADTSCLCVFRPAFDVLALWGTMPHEAGPIGDRIVWHAVKLRGIACAHDREPSVAFRSQYAFHYESAGETPPSHSKRTEVSNTARWFISLPFVSRIGMMLGLGGVDDLAALHAVRMKPATHMQIATLSGSDRALTMELPDNSRIRSMLNEFAQERPYRPVPGLAQPRAVLDIGANVGIAAAYFRLVYPDATLICVEPDPAAYALLAKNAAIIGNCQAIRVGLHHGTQVRPFQLGEEGGGLSSTAATTGRVARLLMVDAEMFVGTLHRRDIDLIKINAQGAEMPIMLSLRQRLAGTNVILLDFHSHTDRRLMDEMLSPTHFLWQVFGASPHRGTLCYVSRAVVPAMPPSQSLA